MRILLISPCHRGFGGWYRAYNISEALKRQGHTTQFIYNKKYNSNIVNKILAGIKNCLPVLFDKYDIIHIFELVQPETLFAGLLSLVLRKRIILDIGDEWLDSPQLRLRHPIAFFLITLFYYFGFRHFPKITTTSDYLYFRIKKSALKLINGVNTREFSPISRTKARRELKIPLDAKLLLSFGNTFEGSRKELLEETYYWIKTFDKSVQLISNRYFNKKKLALYLGACNMMLFPTTDCPNEQACFPIRIGTTLNAGRVIGMLDVDTEACNTLKSYNCLVVGGYPYGLAYKVVEFLNDNEKQVRMENNVLKAKKELDWDNLIKPLEKFYKK